MKSNRTHSDDIIHRIPNDYIRKYSDAGNYLRGLLVLIIKDGKINPHERSIFFREGGELGFEKEFLLNALKTSIENKYLPGNVPKFYSIHYAMKLVEVGVEIVHQDDKIDNNKIEYLLEIARINGITLFLSNLIPKQ